MPSFADSFWSGDYAGGLGVLFGKLQQGVVENDQVLTVARMRADAEEQYGRKLSDIGPATDRMAGGFPRDDGASLRKAYEGVRTEMAEAASKHQKIAANISELVVIPFSRWCEAHEARVTSSHDDLQARIRAHDKQADLVRKLRSTYFNKCRQVEDLEEENKLAFPEPEKQESSPKGKTTPTIKLPEQESEEPEPVEIGDEVYNPEQVKQILFSIISTVKVGETKVPILGTYQNVSTGADITEYIQKNMGASSISYAERIGQDLVNNGFLRLIGNVGNTFANSSKMNYQWRPKVFQITGIPEKRGVSRVNSAASMDSVESPIMGSMGEMLQGWNPLNNPYPNETPLERLRRESKEADEKYKAGVRKLDMLRCNLEEAIIDHLRFMERCELDRVKAIKAVMLDFSGSVSNVIPSLQSTVDNMMLYQEAIQPANDVRYLIDNYRTGSFVPKVQIYDNYYHHIGEQVFGVDLEARARHDRKRVPILITTILTFLDNHYPDLEGDDARRSIWTVDVPLAATHHLRNSINNADGSSNLRDILERYEVPIVASVLKLYLIELPDSLVSAQVYDVVKTIYTSTDSSTNDETRIAVLQNTLGQLRLANIATLDALMTHFTRLLELTSAEEGYVSTLTQALAPCILRPRVESSLTISERHPYRLVRDLFDHKELIFGELKRASSANMGQSKPLESPRARAPTDESNRRANMEARTRAIVSKARAPSPGPALQNRHRRDRSVGNSERFPVVGSPRVDTHSNDHRRHVRQSLEVPDGSPETPHKDSPLRSETATSTAQETPATNGASDYGTPTQTSAATEDIKSPEKEVGIEKQNSLSRSVAARGMSRRNPGSVSSAGMIAKNRDSLASNRDSMGSVPETKANEAHGVELSDKPMED